MSLKKPTNKQIISFKKSLENGGNIAQAMRKAGYKESTVNNPSNLTDSDGWFLLLDIYAPDQKLASKLDEGLNANKQLATRVIFKKEAPTSQSAGELPLASSGTDDFIEVPDHIARHKYLETALKLKKRLLDRKDITSKGEKLESIQVVITEDKPLKEDEQ